MRLCRGNASFGLLRIARGAGAIAFALTAVITASAAEPFDDPNTQKYGWREVWGGADVTKDVWLLYTGVTLAPLSKDIYSDGLRFRVNSGYGQYSYEGSFLDCSASGGNRDKCTSSLHRFHIDVLYTDILIGYHLRLGELTAKAFAGASIVSHKFDAIDATNKVSGVDIGPAVALEFWLNVGRQAWTSLDLSYTTAHDTGAARWRGAWRIQPNLSIGPEVRYDTNAQSEAGRAGLFVRYEWVGGEISTAAGFSRRYCKSGDKFCTDEEQDSSPYVTINLLSQF